MMNPLRSTRSLLWCGAAIAVVGGLFVASGTGLHADDVSVPAIPARDPAVTRAAPPGGHRDRDASLAIVAQDSQRTQRNPGRGDAPSWLRTPFTDDPAALVDRYRLGREAPGLDERKFIAHEIGHICQTAVTRGPRIEIPEASADLLKEIDSARQRLDRACTGFYAMRLEQLQTDNQTLRAAIRSPESAFSTEFSAIRRSDGRLDPELAANNLRASFRAHGPAALLWNDGNLADFLIAQRHGVPPGSTRIVDDLEHRAVTVAMCIGGVPCAGDSLLYLNLCANLGSCGGSIDAWALSGLDAAQRQYVSDRANKIVDAIRRERFGELGF